MAAFKPINLLSASVALVAFLAIHLPVVNAAAAMCQGSSCVFNETVSCEEMLSTMEFHGDGCCLSDHLETGLCVVTVGSDCGWTARCNSGCSGECDDEGNPQFGCVVPYTLYSSATPEECPASSYAFNATETQCPEDQAFDPASLCANDTDTATATATPATDEEPKAEDSAQPLESSSATRMGFVASVFAMASLCMYSL